MTTSKAISTTEGRDLILTRSFTASPEKVFNAWTQSELSKQWFALPPWTTAKAELDVRAGGASLIVMCSPEGKVKPTKKWAFMKPGWR